MGFVTQFFIKPAKPELMQPPAGSFTVTREGQVGISTLPGSFPSEIVKLMAERILATFHQARKAHLPLTELSIEYSLLKFVAYEHRGGAMVFVVPSPSESADRRVA
jgi:hypothetical protein